MADNNKTYTPTGLSYLLPNDDSTEGILFQIDVMDGYLPLEENPNKYGLTGKAEDNSLGTF